MSKPSRTNRWKAWVVLAILVRLLGNPALNRPIPLFDPTERCQAPSYVTFCVPFA